MKHLRYWSLTAFTMALLLLSARACGPDFPVAVFVLPENPDNITAFLGGQMAVLEPGFHTRHLVVAYRYLSGLPLTAEEQKIAASVNEHFVDPDRDGGGRYSDKPLPGFDAWLKVRDGFGPVDGFAPDAKLETDRTVPGGDYDTFVNCLDPAFATAAATLAARLQQHGAKDPAAIEWVRGEDAVFNQCGDTNPTRYFGAGQAPPPKPAPKLPAAVAAGAPLWLQQDRAYQLAAAQFYALDFDAALMSFRAIAADTPSPWAVTARYLVARTLLRMATLAVLPNVHDRDGAPMTEEQRRAYVQTQQKKFDTAQAQIQQTLQEARRELLAMRSEPRMKPMLPAIDDLLDYIAVRLDPQAQSVALAQRFLTPNNPRLRQSLIDFTVLHTTADEGNSITAITSTLTSAKVAPASPSSGHASDPAADLVAWVECLNARDSASAVAHWQAAHTTVWLAAALMLTGKPDAATPALLAAATSLAASDPAYLTITYHRLRLSPRNAATRTKALALLPTAKADGPSTANQFTMLAAATAPTLADWLAAAPREPAGESSWEETDAPSIPKEDVCGRKLASYQLFDTDAAVTLNQYLPLRLLAAAAEGTTLPANLRFQVAQAAWTRAVLLDQPAIARRMTPVLEGCRATWKPVLDAYDASTEPSDRAANGLLALLRFASTEPSVREGEERRGGFATYDNYRQNWWCTTVPNPGGTVDDLPGIPPGDPNAVPTPPPTPPLFLTAADRREADAEVSRLRALPIASTYFAQQALAWARQHPNDLRTPDILGEATRALRSACRNDPPYDPKEAAAADAHPHAPYTAPLAHQLFDSLHQHYPNSPWTKKYPTWE